MIDPATFATEVVTYATAAALAATGVAAVVARFLPPPDNKLPSGYALLYDIVNGMAQNRGHAINATDPTPND